MTFLVKEAFVVARISQTILFLLGKVRFAYMEVNCNFLNICLLQRQTTKLNFLFVRNLKKKNPESLEQWISLIERRTVYMSIKYQGEL